MAELDGEPLVENPRPEGRRAVLRDVVHDMAASGPERECIRFEDGERWNWGQAVQEGYRAANVLAEAGLRRGDTMLVLLPNCADWIRAWWGAAFLGAVVVPVNTANKGTFLEHVCRDSEAELVVTDADLGQRLDTIDLPLRTLDSRALRTGPGDPPAMGDALQPWDPAFINYTSGTTGPSKGAVTSYLHAAMTAYDAWAKRTRRDDCMLVDLPLFHTSGQAPCFGHWSVGGRVALRGVFSASRYLDIVREVGATSGFLVGSMAAMLLAQPERPDDATSPLRRVLAAPMVADPIGFRRRFGVKELFVCYGPTETGALTIVEDATADTRTIGRPRDGVEVRVVDEHDIPVEPGVVGELVARSDQPWEFMSEYWGRPAATAAAFRNGWYHTGDAVVCSASGDYYFRDRVKDSLRRRGENISSFEVEQAVVSFADVLEAACVAAPGEFAGDDEVKVFVVAKPGRTLDLIALVEHLRARMPYFAVPRFIEIADELPKTPTAKVRKFELRARGNTAATWDRLAAGILVDRRS